jgi:hypothetical protein
MLPPDRERRGPTTEELAAEDARLAERIAARIVADLPWAGLAIGFASDTEHCRERIRSLVLDVVSGREEAS